MTHYYDALNRVTRSTRAGAIEQYQRDSMGDVTVFTDPEGRRTSTQYDARRRAIRVTDGAGQSTQHAYDASNNLTTTAQWGEHELHL